MFPYLEILALNSSDDFLFILKSIDFTYKGVSENQISLKEKEQKAKIVVQYQNSAMQILRKLEMTNSD